VTDQPRREVTPADFDRLLEDAREALQELRSGQVQPDGEVEDLVGEGEAADGKVKVTAGIGGKIEKVELDPRALRTDSDELGEQIAEAVNAALKDLQQKASASAAAAMSGFDPEHLSEQLINLQDQSVRQMGEFAAGMEDMLDRIRRAAGIE
jgi:DNA-binding protein YbaB